MDTHTHTDSDVVRVVLLYGTLLSFFLVLALIRPQLLWLSSARYKTWQLNHSSNQNVPSLVVMKYNTYQTSMLLVILLFNLQIFNLRNCFWTSKWIQRIFALSHPAKIKQHQFNSLNQSLKQNSQTSDNLSFSGLQIFFPLLWFK